MGYLMLSGHNVHSSSEGAIKVVPIWRKVLAPGTNPAFVEDEGLIEKAVDRRSSKVVLVLVLEAAQARIPGNIDSSSVHYFFSCKQPASVPLQSLTNTLLSCRIHGIQNKASR